MFLLFVPKSMQDTSLYKHLVEYTHFIIEYVVLKLPSIYISLHLSFEPRQANLCLRAFRHDKFQLRMPSHSEGPGIWLSVWRFLLTHCLYERAAKVLVRLRGCTGSPEPSLLAYAISTKFAWRRPFVTMPSTAETFGPGHGKMCLVLYANNKGAGQPAHPCSLISTFVVRCLDSMICILAQSKVSRF